jgi:hypothetical protein
MGTPVPTALTAADAANQKAVIFLLLWRPGKWYGSSIRPNASNAAGVQQIA